MPYTIWTPREADSMNNPDGDGPVDERLYEQNGTHDSGFVLLTVLLVTAVIAAFATASLAFIRAKANAVAVELRLAQTEGVAEAGLVRIIAAIEASDDPLYRRLRNDRTPVVWRYSDADVLLSLSMEAGKVDLNTGDAALVRSVLRGIVADRSRQLELLSKWEAARRQGAVIESVVSLLSPRDRLSPLARDLEAVFTTVTAAVGVDPLAAPEVVLKQVPGLNESDRAALLQARQSDDKDVVRTIKELHHPILDGERPLFRLRSSVRLPNGTEVTRSALVAQEASSRKLSIASWSSY